MYLPVSSSLQEGGAVKEASWNFEWLFELKVKGSYVVMFI